MFSKINPTVRQLVRQIVISYVKDMTKYSNVGLTHNPEHEFSMHMIQRKVTFKITPPKQVTKVEPVRIKQ